MSIKLNLPADLEYRLHREAERRGVPAETITIDLLEQHLPADNRKTRADAWLEQWTADFESMSEGDFAPSCSILAS